LKFSFPPPPPICIKEVVAFLFPVFLRSLPPKNLSCLYCMFFSSACQRVIRVKWRVSPPLTTILEVSPPSQFPIPALSFRSTKKQNKPPPEMSAQSLNPACNYLPFIFLFFFLGVFFPVPPPLYFLDEIPHEFFFFSFNVTLAYGLSFFHVFFVLFFSLSPQGPEDICSAPSFPSPLPLSL